MPVTIPDDVREILDDRVFAHIATLNPDGSPHSSIIWIERDGDHLRFSTAEGRVKARNLRHDPRVSISLSPVDGPYRSITIQGRVTELANDGTWLIDRLAKKYLGEEKYPYGQPGEVRLNAVVEVLHVAG